jgi:hypothetical protein
MSAHSNGVPFRVLAQEYKMLESRQRISCQAFAAGLLANSRDEIEENPINKQLGGVTAGDFREITYEALLKREERRKPGPIDIFSSSLRHRESHVVMQKAQEVLDSCTYRTTNTYQHRVALISTTIGKTSFTGDRENLPAREKLVKGKKKSFIPRRSLITITLNLQRWARVYLYCGGVVEEQSGENVLRHFIYEIFKVKSEDELYVHIMKQSTGYRLQARKAVIRRAHDGIWRIHDWPVVWP